MGKLRFLYNPRRKDDHHRCNNEYSKMSTLKSKQRKGNENIKNEIKRKPARYFGLISNHHCIAFSSEQLKV